MKPADMHCDKRRSQAAIDVTLVTAAGCHYCDAAAALLAQLAEAFPLRIRIVDLSDGEGAAIARRFRVPFPPVLLIDGDYFGHGRISGRKLTKHLTQIASQGVTL